MLRHVIAPVRSYTKAANEILYSRRMNSDAKVLILIVQSLPEQERYEALGKYAEALELTPREYRNARKHLIANGYLHEWRWQNDRGRWVTDQLASNVTLTSEEAIALRGGGEPPESPSGRQPKAGSSRDRNAQTYKPVDKDSGKNDPHPPPKRGRIANRTRSRSRSRTRPPRRISRRTPHRLTATRNFSQPNACCSPSATATRTCCSGSGRRGGWPSRRRNGSVAGSRPPTCAAP